MLLSETPPVSSFTSPATSRRLPDPATFDSDRRPLGHRPRVLILKAGRLCREALTTSIAVEFADIDVIVCDSIGAAEKALSTGPIDTIVTGLALRDGVVLERLGEWMNHAGPGQRVLVVTARTQPAVLHSLRDLLVPGVVDENAEGHEGLVGAYTALAAGQSYWSPGLRESVVRHCLQAGSLFRVLSSTERMVLGVIGDGCDDATAAGILPLSQNTIRSVRASLHRKLGVQHKGELLARADEYGFVIRAQSGIIRPGLSRLMTQHTPAAARRTVPMQQVA